MVHPSLQVQGPFDSLAAPGAGAFTSEEPLSGV